MTFYYKYHNYRREKRAWKAFCWDRVCNHLLGQHLAPSSAFLEAARQKFRLEKKSNENIGVGRIRKYKVKEKMCAIDTTRTGFEPSTFDFIRKYSTTGLPGH